MIATLGAQPPDLDALPKVAPWSSPELDERRLHAWAEEEGEDAELRTLAGHLSAATARLVELVWSQRVRYGPNVAPYLAQRCGITTREASEYLRVAEALRDLPVTRAAFGRGELTFAKVRLLTRVATPASETDLVELAAAATASQLQRAVRLHRTLTVDQATRSHEREFVEWWSDGEGSVELRARLAAEDGGLLLQALDAARERVQERRRRERATARDGGCDEAPPTPETGGPPRPVAVEALVEVARAALSSPGAPDDTGARLIVHVDAATLTRDTAGRCELEHGEVLLAPETARRLGCDAKVVAQVERDGLPITVGRARRTVPPRLRRLLEARDDRRCTFPGCERTYHLEAHHLHHWAHGGETSLDNLALLCPLHHRLLHEGGYTVSRDDTGDLVFVLPTGLPCPTRPAAPRAGSLDGLIADHDRAGIHIGPDTNRRGGTGPERFDLELTVDAITSIVERAGEPPPESPP